MPTVSVKGVNIYYESVGEGEPIVLVSGFISDHTVWAGVVGDLAKTNRVVVFDNRGAGRSSTPRLPYTVAMMSEDVLGLMDALEIPQAHFVGQSMGGAMVQWLAAHHGERVKSAILFTTFAKLGLLPLAAFDSVQRLMEHGVPRRAAIETIIPWVFSATFMSTPGNIAMMMEADQANQYPQTLDGYKNQLAALHAFDSRPYLPKIRVPVHVVATGADLISPPADSEEVVRAIPGATMQVLPGIGHAIQAEQPKLVGELIREKVTNPGQSAGTRSKTLSDLVQGMPAAPQSRAEERQLQEFVQNFVTSKVKTGASQAEPAGKAPKKSPKIVLKLPITVIEFAGKTGLKPIQVIADLVGLGLFFSGRMEMSMPDMFYVATKYNLNIEFAPSKKK